jgi:hypothetical protein
VVPPGYCLAFPDQAIGSLEYLNLDLRVALKVNFTGLRVRMIVPAMTTFSSGPAKITLSYTRIGIV